MIYKPEYPQPEELAVMSAQDVFDRAAVHLIKQGRRASNEVACLYRGPENTCCAVGALIPEALYQAGFENGNVERLISGLEDGVLLKFLHKHRSLLNDLQSVHDNEDIPPQEWPICLAGVADDHGLNTDALDIAVS